jgi:hypothetical protein
MKPELEQKIIDIAPYMFRYDGWGDPMQSLLCFGFEVGDGWYELIKSLVMRLAELDKEHKSVRVQQVKEKYGTLRFYVYGGDDTVWNEIMLAELESAKVCETCGEPGKLVGTGWVATLCPVHAKGYDL